MSSPERGQEASLHELLDALNAPDEGNAPSPACALCRLTARSVERDIRAFFAEFVNDPQVRDGLRKARGFCAEHTPLLASLGDALAVAILYADLTRLTREEWLAEETGLKSLRLGRRRGGRAPSASCPACVTAQAASARYANALAAGLETEAVQQTYVSGSGLCVVHTEQVMAAAKPAVAVWVRQQEVERLQRLQADLEEIIRKNDYRFRGEAWGNEKDAWLRALQKITRPRT